MRKLKLNFVDFWPNLIKDDNYFFNLLKTRYDVEIDEVNPDILFFSVDYNNARERDRYKNCLKVFYTGEDAAPNWNECDLAYTFRHSTDPREYRLPLWAIKLNWFNRPYNDDRDQANLVSLEEFMNKPKQVVKPNFCGFVATQPKGKRVEFVPKLSKYKTVDCCGPLYNNTGYLITDKNGKWARGDQKYKIEWLKQYKFNIAMENCESPGYCADKLIHSMFATCVPIYWGSTTAKYDFNPDSFINCHDFSSDEEVIEKIKELDMDIEKYKNVLKQPWFKDNKIPDFIQPENVITLISSKIK